jgi:hypothetical protein
MVISTWSQGKPLPKWKSNATEFTVSVNYHPTRGIQVFLPKPLAELLGNPPAITFVLKGKRIEVNAGNRQK